MALSVSVRLAAAKTVTSEAQIVVFANRANTRSNRRTSGLFTLGIATNPLYPVKYNEGRPFAASVACGSVFKRRQYPAERFAAGGDEFRFEPLVVGKDLLAEAGELRAAMRITAATGDHQRLLKAAIHGPHQEPGAVVRHSHSAGGLGNGTGFGNVNQQFRLARAERNFITQINAEIGREALASFLFGFGRHACGLSEKRLLFQPQLRPTHLI
jgi:hypothetical protein